MSNIWFTSDWHFNHNKDFIYKERGFKDLESMNETLVQRHNALVRPDDIVYVLGDLVMGNIYEGVQYIKRLNGHLRIIKGNHDTDNKVKILTSECNNIEWVSNALVHNISKTKDFFLCHYPVLCGDNISRHKMVSIHGHTHSKLIFPFSDSQMLMYNVAVDAHNSCPISQEEILVDLKNHYGWWS